MKTLPLTTMALATLALGLGSVLVTVKTAGNQPSQTPAPSQNQTAQTQTPPVPEPHEDARGRLASTLIGRDVVGVNDEPFGELRDFIVDANSGRIIYGVVSSGGTAGAGGALRAVPFNAFLPELAANGLRMRISIEQAVWKDAPRFENQHVDALSGDSMQRDDLYHHFGQQPPMSPQPGRQSLELVSETIGKPLHRGEETIGEIKDVVVHLDAQMAAVLIDPKDDFVGTDQTFILPFGRLVRTENDAFGTTLSRQDFTSAQVSTDETWALSTDAFRTPYLWPAYGTSATPLAGTPTPPFPGRGLSASRPPVSEIRDALAADPNTRWSAVRVVAAHDRVILQGTVQDEDDKRRIESRAAQSAGGWNIDNQLRIAGAIEE